MSVRSATAADVRTAAATLGRAFADDPVATWAAGRDPVPEKLGARFFGVSMRNRLPHVDLAEEGASVAVWGAPGQWRPSFWSALRVAPALLRLTRHRLPLAARALATVEKAHPHLDHWYLETLGTDPARQGEGLASAVLAPVLGRCDEDGIGAYLESSKESNLPFYERHGFAVTEELDLPGGGPRIWLMWRDPVPPGHRG